MMGYNDGSVDWWYLRNDIGGLDIYESISYISCIGGVVGEDG